VATQYLAGRFNYDPALGFPVVAQVYQPFGWISWQFAPWAAAYRYLFRPVDMSLLATAVVAIGAAALLSGRHRRPRQYDDVHGSAGFMTSDDIEQSGYLDQDDGVYIGAWTDPAGEVHYLRHDGAEHVAGIAPTRSGKGVGLVMPTLLSWPHSAVIFDEKGELWELTSGWRKQAGSSVLRWQPGHPTASCGFNFLEEIRWGTPHDVADAQNIAVMIIDPDGHGFKDHWDRTAFGLLSGVILHIGYKFREQGLMASLPDVAYALSDPAKPADLLYAEMAKNKHVNGNLHKAVAASGADQLNREDRERSSVLSTVTTYMQIFQDPIVAANSDHSDLRILDVANHRDPVSLYIVVPGDDKARLKPLVRLMLTMLMRGLTGAKIEFETKNDRVRTSVSRFMPKRFAKLEPNAARLPKMPHRHRLLFMLDEFPSLGRLAVIEDALAKCAGFGIKAYLIMQDREQLLATYPHETILSNCHIRIAYAPNKLETAEWLSKELDTQTINLEIYSESGKRSGYLSQVSHSITQTGRALMTPGEVMRLPGPVKSGSQIVSAGELLLMTAGKRPIRGRQILYFEDPTFAARAAILPPPTTDTLSGPRFVLP
jgi:type IV secretion system protein VirD4